MSGDKGASAGSLEVLADAMSSSEPDALDEALAGLDGEDWVALEALIGTRATRAVRGDRDRARATAAKRGHVVLLPGMMGTDLAVLDKDEIPSLVWFHVKALASGGLQKLAIPRDGTDPPFRVQPGGLMKLYYLRMQLRLAVNWRTQLFPYDWRLSIADSAEELAEVVGSLEPPTHLVAHSMGGLVARAMMARHKDVWERMRGSTGTGPEGGRLVMLGTPNLGSFSPVLAFTGRDLKIRALSLLDRRLRKDDVVRVLASFPGLYEMLPDRLSDLGGALGDLYDAGGWPGSVVDERLLASAAEFHDLVREAVAADRMVYVAGFGHKTVDGLKRNGSKFSWHATRNGDGTVPHLLGRLPAVPTFWSTAKHGSLARDENVLKAIDDLLLTGTTRHLPAGPEPPGSRGDPDVGAWLDDDELLSETAVEALRARGQRDARLILADVLPVEEDLENLRQLPMKVEVVWGDIGQVDADVIAVGHYDGVFPTAAEAALDSALSGDVMREDRILYQATTRGALSGELGRVNLYPWPAGDGNVRTVAVVGLGRPGTFGIPHHELLIRNLLWMVERGTSASKLAMVLIGSGAGNLTIRDTVHNLVRSLEDAARQGDLGGRISVIRIVEKEYGRARTIHRELAAALGKRTPGVRALIELHADVLECAEGTVSVETALLHLLVAATRRHGALEEEVGRVAASAPVAREVVARLAMLKNVLVEDFEVSRPVSASTTEVPTRISILVRDNKLIVAAISDAATIAERELGLELELFEALVAQANAEAAGNLDLAGELLLRLTIPVDFRQFLAGGHAMIFEVDKTTAGIPWEVLKTDIAATHETRFLGLRTPTARQLRTSLSPPPVVTGQVRLRRVLLIGDPGAPGGGRLPGARAEVDAIVTLLNERHVECDVLLGPHGGTAGEPAATVSSVVHHLLHFDYDIVHYAGHGTFSSADPAEGSGWMLADGLLKGAHLTMMERLPPLLVANACHSGRVSTGFPGLADEFMGRGVRNLLGTARAVNDESARAFSEVLYRDLVPYGSTHGSTLGKAVLNARKTLMAGDQPEWDAYHLYGDPDLRFSAERSQGH